MPPAKYPYRDVGCVLRGRVAWAREGGGAFCRGKRFEDSSSPSGIWVSPTSEAALLKKKDAFKNTWRKIVRDAMNSRVSQHTSVSTTAATDRSLPPPPFEVHYAGETAMSIMTGASPLHFYVTYTDGSVDEETARRNVLLMHNAVLGFDAGDAKDAMHIGEMVLEYVESLVGSASHSHAESLSGKMPSVKSSSRRAMTVVKDAREGLVGFVIRNVPLCPPEDVKSAEKKNEEVEEDEEECHVDNDGSSGASQQQGRTLVDLRITLPCGLGPALHQDTLFLTENMGSSPYLQEAIQATILWAKAQRFFLDDEGFVKLYAQTRTETVLRGTAVEDLFYRTFGTMSICSLLIRAMMSPELLTSDAAGLSRRVDDPAQDSDDETRIGRAFIAFVRFLASKAHFALTASPSLQRRHSQHSGHHHKATSTSTTNSCYTIALPTLTCYNARCHIQLSSIIGRSGVASSSKAELKDCRKQYHYIRELAALTERFLGAAPEDLEEDVIKRFFGEELILKYVAAQQAAAVSGTGAQLGDDDKAMMAEARERWIDAVLFGALSEGRNDQAHVDPLRTIRSCSRCEECGVGNVAKSLSKGSTLCAECQLTKMKTSAMLSAATNQSLSEATTGRGAGDNAGEGATANESRGRGRGGASSTRGRGGGSTDVGAVVGTAVSCADEEPSKGTTMRSRGGGRGRGRGAGASAQQELPSPAETNRSLIDGINYEGICTGCDRERPYLVGKPLTDLCANCR